jgi:hypothetical protein
MHFGIVAWRQKAGLFDVHCYATATKKNTYFSGNEYIHSYIAI